MNEVLKQKAVVWATAFRRMHNGCSMAELRFDGIAGCFAHSKGWQCETDPYSSG